MSEHGPKRDPLQRAKDRRETAALYLQGFAMWEIAEKMGVSRVQIGKDLKHIFKGWRQRLRLADERERLEVLAGIKELRRTYWNAWHNSRRPKRITSTETTTTASGGSTKRGTRVERRDGNPEFLKGVERCYLAIAKILGMLDDEPVKDARPPVTQIIVGGTPSPGGPA